MADDPERPLTGVVLVLNQGRDDQALGVADAGPGPDFATQWSVRIPADARVGHSTLTAGDTTLMVNVQV